MQNLSGKTAIVTGGASGIGLAISRSLLSVGMNVAIADIQSDTLEEAVASLEGGERVLALRLDVTDRDAYRAFADRVEQRFGHIHVLVNNAGVVVSGPVEQASYSDWDWILDVNLKGVINGIVTVLPRMLAHGEGGHIVNTASTSGLLPHPGAAIYVASKSAVIGMTESMRCELEPKGIVVSVLCPGPVLSRITEAGRNRQATYGDSGYQGSGFDTNSEGAAEALKMMMPPDQVGEIVRAGIEKDSLYIFTHNEHREGLATRAAAIEAALPRRPESDALKTMMAGTMINPAHVAEIARHRNDS